MKAIISIGRVSLTPGFSPVNDAVGRPAVLTAFRARGQTVETVSASGLSARTGLKPGVNDTRLNQKFCR
jgi:hypothetical protein